MLFAEYVKMDENTVEYPTDRKWDVDRYLERICMKRPTRLDVKYLNQLIEHHLIYIPFENMDLFTGKADISQDLDKLYEKVVIKKRGGYCFELNKTFHFLLKDLGYDTYPCFCRVQEGQTESEDISHRGNIVRLDGKILFCDVGYGNAMSRGAIELKEHIRQRYGMDTFWIERYNDYWFDLFRQPQDIIHEDGTVAVGRAVRELRICLAPAEERDFVYLNAIMNAQDSCFRKVVMVGRLTKNGALSINPELVFSRTTGNRKERRKLSGDQELWQVLREEFGIRF